LIHVSVRGARPAPGFSLCPGVVHPADTLIENILNKELPEWMSGEIAISG
jgi:hypothetical protein